jgi:hypothetical protein
MGKICATAQTIPVDQNGQAVKGSQRANVLRDLACHWMSDLEMVRIAGLGDELQFFAESARRQLHKLELQSLGSEVYMRLAKMLSEMTPY